MTVKNLQPGTVVRALKPLDPEGANITRGEVGEVMYPADYYEPGSGPLVRWPHGRACNVYEGDVEALT